MGWQTCETQDFYFLAEAAKILRMTVKQLGDLVRARKIVAHQTRPGGRIRISHDDLLAYVQTTRLDTQPETERGTK